MQPHEIMRATEAIGSIGGAFYFHPDTTERGKQAGLDGFRMYFLGRGGVLGDVEPEVVLSAWGYFHPALIAKMWNTAKERMAPRDAARLYIDCAHELGRAKFSEIEGLDRFVAAATQVVGSVSGDSRALFAAVRAEPVPADAPAAALHLAMVLREMRGSTHLLALASVGLSSPIAHAIKRPADVKTFGWADGEIPDPTEEDRAKWAKAEALTDELLTPAYAALSATQAAALIAGTTAMAAALVG
jgi:hypothetical protein